MSIFTKGKNLSRRVFSWLSIICFSCFSILTVTPYSAQARESLPFLPEVGQRISLSESFAPPVIKGIQIFPDNPLRFDFIIDTGHSHPENLDLQAESGKLIKYFLTSLTVPSQDLWVNLSPHEKERIIPEKFGNTQMGRDLLAQDYLLKQVTASLIYPEEALGQTFWEEIYSGLNDQFGLTEIPVNTFNKVWIVPDKAVVFENGALAFVESCHLKVMLEEDYRARQKAHDRALTQVADTAETSEISRMTSEAIRTVILPAIEKEVNSGAHFTRLRQIAQSLVLATWFKKKLLTGLEESKTRHLFATTYLDRNLIEGVDIDDKQIKEKIYAQYLEAFKQGVYNYIREDYDPDTQNIIPRKYFSGGMAFNVDAAMVTQSVTRGQITETLFDQRFAGTTQGSLLVANTNIEPRITDPNLITRLDQETAINQSGLIGKYKVISPVEIREGSKEIRFTGTHIETNRQETITLKILHKKNAAEALGRLWALTQSHSVLSGILEWYNTHFQDYYVIAENPYGIQGLGQENVIAVSQRFSEEPIVLLHEIAEAMGHAGRLQAENILPLLKDTAWFYEHIRKPGRKGMDLHYALRALMRELNTQADRSVTLEIQGRFSIKEAADLAKQLSPQLMTPPLLKDFRAIRETANSRAEEETLIRELIKKHEALQKAQDEERARKAEKARQRSEEEQKQRSAIRAILKAARNTHNDFSLNPDTKNAQVKSRLEALYVMNPEWVRQETGAFLRANTTFATSYFNGILMESFFEESMENVPALILDLYQGIGSRLNSFKDKKNTLRLLSNFLNKIRYLPSEKLLEIYTPLQRDINAIYGKRPSVQRHKVMMITHYEDFFDQDPQNADILYFKENFNELIRRNVRIRDEKKLQFLVSLHAESTFTRRALNELFSALLKKDRGATLSNLLIADIRADQFPSLEAKAFVLESLISTKKILLGIKAKEQIIDTLLTLLAEPATRQQQKALRANLNNLALGDLTLPAKEKIADTFRAALTETAGRIQANTQEINKIDTIEKDARDNINDPAIQKMMLDETKKEKEKALKEQESLMEQMENQIKTLTRLIIIDSEEHLNMLMALNTIDLPSETLAFENGLINHLKNLLADETLDINIRAEIISNFRNLFMRGNERISPFFQEAIDTSMPEDIRALTAPLLQAKDSDITEAGLTAALSQPGLPEKTGLLLILKIQRNETLLDRIIANKEIPAGLRLYAFSWYASQFLHHFTRDEQKILITTYDQEKLNSLLASLENDALQYLKDMAKDPNAVKQMIDDIMLQDEVAQTYMMAAFTVIQNSVAPVSAKTFISIASHITESKIMAYYENANARLHFGGKILKRAQDPTQFFFQVASHELMHTILSEEYLYEPVSLNQSILHELLSDVTAFALSKETDMDTGIFKEAVRFTEDFLRVAGDDYHSVEGHEGARAQLTEIEAFFDSRQSAWDPKKMLRTALRLLTNFENKNKSPKEFTQLMLRHYNDPRLFYRSKEEGAVSDQDTNFFASLSPSQKDVLGIPTSAAEPLREPILKRQEISAFFEESADYAMTAQAAGPQDQVGGINLDPALMELQTTGQGLPLILPKTVTDTLQPSQINGFTPVIFSIHPFVYQK